jgi:phosphonate transport system substrate-binding protein
MVHRPVSRLVGWSLWLLLLALLPACQRSDPSIPVNLSERQTLADSPPAEQTLSVCVGSMITPLDGYIYYQRLIDHLGRRLGMRVQALDFPSYREVNQQLRSGEVELAFVCGGPYVAGEEEFGLQLLAVPEVAGRAEYHSYLIVPADSPARSLADLRGKTFAFADPDSNSGFIAPSYELAQMGETAEGFFSSVLFTYAHDRSIRIVAEKLVDGAAVDSLIWDYLLQREPELAEKVKVIARSPAFGIPPVVASPAMDPQLRQAVTEVLLGLHLEPEGREILRGMGIDRFVAGEDASYDSIRQMRRTLARPDHPRKGP